MTSNFKKDYSYEDVVKILNLVRSGASNREIANEMSRTVGGINVIVMDYRLFAKEGRHSAVGTQMRKFIKRYVESQSEVPTMNNHAEEEKTPTSLTKLESAFKDFQNVIVEVIDAEVERRDRNLIVEMNNLKSELAKYKEAAQNSSVVGVLRHKWGLS